MQRGVQAMLNNSVEVESNSRLSQSILWQLQREYFEREGVNAWTGQVPNFVTCNTFVANCYANLVVRFISDWLDTHPDAITHPFYILELGTGTGQLSFYVVKRMKELFKELNMTEIKFCYVMSDFTQSNLDFFQSQPKLKEFIDEGIMDYALFNMEEDDQIHLVTKKSTLSSRELVNPLIVFANYIFDTIAHDCFSIQQNTLREVTLNINTSEKNMQQDSVVSMDKLNIQFNENDIEGPYYEEPIFNEILEGYRTSIKNSKILLPISSLRALERLRKLSNGKMFLISSDKGYSSIEQLEQLSYPHISFHGSFSLMVNFNAIADYFVRVGGDYFFQSSRKGIKTCVFASGMHLSQLPKTTYAMSQFVEDFSPADYFILHRYISDTFQTAKLDLLISYLVLTGYDPYMYNRLHGRIQTLLTESDQMTIDHLLTSLHRIANNYYATPATGDTLFDIALTFQTLHRYSEANQYYQESIKYFGKQYGSLYNLAICHHHLGNSKDSLNYFQEAEALKKSVSPVAGVA